MQDPKAVKASLEQLTTEYPRDFAARNNFGVYYNGTGEYEEALKQYRAASDLAPDEPGPVSNAAYVLLTLGRYDEASQMVDRALAIRPDPNLALARWITAKYRGAAAHGGVRERRAQHGAARSDGDDRREPGRVVRPLQGVRDDAARLHRAREGIGEPGRGRRGRHRPADHAGRVPRRPRSRRAQGHGGAREEPGHCSRSNSRLWRSSATSQPFGPA